MLSIAIIVVTVFLLLVVWLVYSFATAPYGHEDQDGFHYDDPPEVNVEAALNEARR